LHTVNPGKTTGNLIHLQQGFAARPGPDARPPGRACRRAAADGQIPEISRILVPPAPNWQRETLGVTLPGMRDPDEDDDLPPPREDRLFGSSSGFRRKLSEGLTGLLDPEGALGKGKDFVTGVSQATKTEVVRMVSAEVRNFLDGMDTVELMQSVIAGLVIDVKAEIRFSIDPNGQLKTSLTTKDSEVRSASEERAKKQPRNPEAAREPARSEPARSHEPRSHEPARSHEPRSHEPRSHEPARSHEPHKPGGKHE